MSFDVKAFHHHGVTMPSRRFLLASLTVVATLALPLAAQAQQFFRIGTGGTGGTY
jgi:TRAP-type uncharacterized transport system substrate-binding protein